MISSVNRGDGGFEKLSRFRVKLRDEKDGIIKDFGAVVFVSGCSINGNREY